MAHLEFLAQTIPEVETEIIGQSWEGENKTTKGWNFCIIQCLSLISIAKIFNLKQLSD